MQTLIPQIFRKFFNPNSQFYPKGFTFLEILVVLTLIILILGSITPNFFNFFSKPHESEFKHLTSVIKVLRNDAIIKNYSYCLIFDLSNQQMLTSKQNLQGNCSKNNLMKPKILEPHNFSEEIILQEARLAGKNLFLNQKYRDKLTIYINSSGFVTPFFLKFSLKDFSKVWIIKSIGITGKLELNEE